MSLTRDKKRGKNRGIEYGTDPVKNKKDRVTKKAVRQAHHSEDIDDLELGEYQDLISDSMLDHIR